MGKLPSRRADWNFLIFRHVNLIHFSLPLLFSSFPAPLHITKGAMGIGWKMIRRAVLTCEVPPWKFVCCLHCSLLQDAVCSENVAASSSGLLQLLSWNLSGGTEEKHWKPESGKQVPRPRFDPSTSRMQAYANPLLHWRTNSTGLSPSREAASRSGIQEFLKILRIPKVHYRVHKSRPLVPTRATSIQSILSHPISLRSTLILSYGLRLCLPSCLFPYGFPTKTIHAFRFAPFVLHALYILSSLTYSF
jgi:hypothetical protein